MAAEREERLAAMAGHLRDVVTTTVAHPDTQRAWAVRVLTAADATHDWAAWREASERLGTLDRLLAHSYLLDAILASTVSPTA